MTLLAAYGFGAGSGSTIADDSGNGHTLTVGSGGSYTASGHTGSGFQNTGGTATTGASGTVPAVTGTDCTLMAWVKPTALPAGGVHLVCGAMQPSGSTDFAIYTQRGDFGTHDVLQGDARLGGGPVSIAGPALTVGTWAHIALTYDGSSLVLYLNGTVAATGTITNTINNTTNFVVAGFDAIGTGAVVVDDVRYYNETLNAAAINTAMNTPVGAPVTDLTLTDAPTPARLGSTSATPNVGIVLKDVISPARLGSTPSATAIGLTLLDSPAVVRTGGLFGDAAGSGMGLVDPIVVPARLGGADSAIVRALALADLPAPARLGAAQTGLTIVSGSEFFVCQDFAGTAAPVSYGGTATVLAYAGSDFVDSLAGSADITSYGGEAANCGR